MLNRYEIHNASVVEGQTYPQLLFCTDNKEQAKFCADLDFNYVVFDKVAGKICYDRTDIELSSHIKTELREMTK